MPSTTNNNGAAFLVMSLAVVLLMVLAIATANSGNTTLTEAEYHGQLIADGMRGIKCYLSYREANPDTVSSVGIEQLNKCFMDFDKLAKKDL